MYAVEVFGAEGEIEDGAARVFLFVYGRKLGEQRAVEHPVVHEFGGPLFNIAERAQVFLFPGIGAVGDCGVEQVFVPVGGCEFTVGRPGVGQGIVSSVQSHQSL